MDASQLPIEWSQLWRPPERLTLSQWAEKNFHLSPEYSAITGLLRLYGWQREIFDSFTDPTVQRVVLKVSTQVVKTLFIQAALAYVIAEDPGPTLLCQPKEDDARDFSKERISPMLRDCPILHGRVSGDESSRDKRNTILYKQFPGGVMAFVGAGAPGNAARRSTRNLFCDEVNKYETSKEGDFVSLAEKRTMTYASRRKIILACSPTEPTAKISTEYEASDQRKPWAKCWSCGEPQILTFNQVKWDSKTPGGILVPNEEKPRTARYECEQCGTHWNDAQRWAAADASEWIAAKPFQGTAGFWISHIYSPLRTHADIVQEWLKVHKNPSELRTFVNTTLAEDWIEKGEAPDWKRLYERREDYKPGIVPRRALLLTAAVDVQGDRLEIEIKAWGRGKECWSIWYEVIRPTRQVMGKEVPCGGSSPEPWLRVAELIAQDWECEGGGKMAIMACAVDTGHAAQVAYDFCRQYPQPAHGPAGSRVHAFRTVIPIKGGHNAFKLIEGASDTDAAKKRGGLKIITIGTPHAKQEIYDCLRIESPVDGGAFPLGYCHHPDYDSQYFQGLCAESRVVKANGAVEWRKEGRNEPLDLHVYNRGAAALCGIDRFAEEHWRELEQRREAMAKPVQLPTQPVTGPARPVRGKFI